MNTNNPIYHNFKEMLEDRVKLSPNDNAFIYFDEDKIKGITYQDFYKLIIDKTKEFSKEPGESKAIIGPMSVDYLVNFFASVLSNKKTMLIDAMLPLQLILMMIKISKVESLAVNEDYFEEQEIKMMKNFLSPYTYEKKSDGEGDILFFTSGTTSISKAVVLTSTSLMRASYNGQACLPIKKSDILLSSLPMSHVFGFVCAMLWPLSNGATTAISRGLRYIPQDLALFKATVLSQVPTAVNMLIKFNTFNKELKTILIGAGPISYESIKAIRKKNINVSFGYGLTETSSGVAISVDKEDPYAMDLCPDTIVKIANDGEILLKTSCLMKGYFNDQASTRKAIIDGYLHTNDIGFLDDENALHITGRKNDVVVLENGTKINLEQWEKNLSKYLSDVDYALGLINNKLVLYYYSDNPSISEEQIKEIIERFNRNSPLGQAIQGEKKLNHKIPRTLTGKIKRYELGAKDEQRI